ncbi:hypothetical protein [Rudaea sp.]|uniref:hypothetical protein n=1 Tax=Rudaea sp. TaxID=2136325 RepID=UPI002ED03A3E
MFESLPGKHISQCDPHFVGKWRLLSQDTDRKDDKSLFLVVEPGCMALHLFENGKDDTETDRQTHLAFASVGTKSLLAVKFDNDKSHTDKVDWSNGFHYFLYDLSNHEIRLRPADDVAVAHLIIDGKLQGRTEKISAEPGGQHRNHGSELHNYVAGDSEAMAKAVELGGVFADTPYFTLKPATDAEISASAKPSPKSK